jgi:electron transport complex protein RnfC
MTTRLRPPTFRHGVHPEAHKETAGLPIERVAFVPKYTVLMSQHGGAASRPVVRMGDRIRRGQIVGEPDGFVSSTVHSPVTGRVAAITSARHPRGDFVVAVEIDADPFSTQRFEERPPIDWRALDQATFLAHVQRAGIVGLGGAAFPAHVKYRVPEGRPVERLVVNGCECEPYLTCDHRLMVERPEAILRGIEIIAKRLGVNETVIGVEENKADAVAALRAAVPPGASVQVQPLPVKYPQGAEKMLVKALFGIEIPAGKYPIDVGMVINNVGTMTAITDYFDTGMPLIERVITVAGPGVKRAANVLVPIGTPVRDVLEHCGGLASDARSVVLGGPMMGSPIASLDVPVLKGTSGILAFTDAEMEELPEYVCVKCGRCVDACPNFLNPQRLARLARAGRYERMEELFVMDCMECGSCSWACPSNIPIVHLIRAAKSDLRARLRRAKGGGA